MIDSHRSPPEYGPDPGLRGLRSTLIRGRLKGLPVPGRGKLVELQAFDGGKWRTFAQPRSRKSGRYKAVYRLRRTFGPRTFTFRARVRREGGYPYELGYSRKVRVRVR